MLQLTEVEVRRGRDLPKPTHNWSGVRRSRPVEATPAALVLSTSSLSMEVLGSSVPVSQRATKPTVRRRGAIDFDRVMKDEPCIGTIYTRVETKCLVSMGGCC